MLNNTQKISAVLFPLLSISILLSSGCGGGGGSSGSFVSSPVAISSTNAPKVAADSALVSGAVGGASSGGGGVTPASAHPATSDTSLWMILDRQFKRINGPSVPTHPLPGMVTAQGFTTTVSCASNNSGSGSYVIDQTSNTAATITFTNCIESNNTETLNGTLIFSNISVNGTTAAGHMSTTGFTVDDTQHSYVLNGSADFTDSMPNTVDTFTMLNGPLTITVDGASNILNNFTIIFTEDASTPLYTMNVDGTLDSQALGGHVTLHTTAPFVSANIDGNNPDSGSMLITGANNSSVKVTALGGDNVQLDVDADGDGMVDPDGTSSTKWTTLEALSL
jgi:hypothetical protein